MTEARQSAREGDRAAAEEITGCQSAHGDARGKRDVYGLKESCRRWLYVVCGSGRTKWALPQACDCC